MITDQVMAPLAVWDVREERWWHGPREARERWLESAGLLNLKIYRAEFWLADAPFARIYRYALNAEGKRHWLPSHVRGPHDHDACDVAREDPRDVPLDSLPPEELW